MPKGRSIIERILDTALERGFVAPHLLVHREDGLKLQGQPDDHPLNVDARWRASVYGIVKWITGPTQTVICTATGESPTATLGALLRNIKEQLSPPELKKKPDAEPSPPEDHATTEG